MDGEAIKRIIDVVQDARGAESFQVPHGDLSVPLIIARGVHGEDVVHSMKKYIDEWRDNPERVRGVANVDTLASFNELVNRHKGATTAVFASIDGKALRAVIDYHGPGASPRFGHHSIVYSFPLSPEWADWNAKNGAVLTQSQWAEFIEDHVADLSSPTDGERSEFERLFQTKFALPSDMIQMSRGMSIAVESRVKEVRTLQSGEVEVSYEEVHKDGTGARLTVPGLFVVSIPLFVGSERERLIARLRYRKQDARLVWFYQFYRANDVFKAAMERDAQTVKAACEVPVFYGMPER